MQKTYFILIVFWVTFFGCATPEKLNRMMNKLPKETAKQCAVRFPVQEKIDTIEVLDSATLEMYEREYAYMYTFIDSLLSIKVDTQARRDIMYLVERLPAAPSPVKYITKVVENKAKYQVILDSCSHQTDSLLVAINYKNNQIAQSLSVINKQAEDIKKYKSERNQARWWILLLIGIIFRRQIYRAAKRIITKI